MPSTFYPIIIISRLVIAPRNSPTGVFRFPQEMEGWVPESWVTPVNTGDVTHKVVATSIKVKYIYPVSYFDVEAGRPVFPQEIKGWDSF
jgi:hypothetical protein